MVMRMPIPLEMREMLEEDPFMQTCLMEGDGLCEGKIEWQHAMTYAGKRINELYAILPLCHAHHVRQAEFRPIQEYWIRERIYRMNAEASFKEKYPRSDLFSRFDS